MHKLLLNHARLDIPVRPRGGFLVKTGDKGRAMLHPELSDMVAMRTRVEGRETVYLPGSTIKGCFRSAAERALRSLGPNEAALACDPNLAGGPCHKDVGGGEAAAVHRAQCLACRVFGSQATGGRALFADAFPTPESWDSANQTEFRAGVSIDRRTGGPAQGKLFDSEVVVGGVYTVSIQLENIQLWQLALFGALLDDLELGLLRMGGGRTRGLGTFIVEGAQLRLSLWRVGAGAGFAGVGALRPGMAQAYGWLEDGEVALPGGETRRGGRAWSLVGDNARAALVAAEEQGWPSVLRRAGGAA